MKSIVSALRKSTRSSPFFMVLLQIHPVSAMIVTEYVNARRAKVGSCLIEDYLGNWGITWNAQKHLKRIEMEEEKRAD